jgi:hypothetical protein
VKRIINALISALTASQLSGQTEDEKTDGAMQAFLPEDWNALPLWLVKLSGLLSFVSACKLTATP